MPSIKATDDNNSQFSMRGNMHTYGNQLASHKLLLQLRPKYNIFIVWFALRLIQVYKCKRVSPYFIPPETPSRFIGADKIRRIAAGRGSEHFAW